MKRALQTRPARRGPGVTGIALSLMLGFAIAAPTVWAQQPSATVPTSTPMPMPAPAPASTSAPPALDGAWNAQIAAPNGRHYTARVNLNGQVGDWKTNTSDPNNLCTGRLAPVEWRRLEDGTVLLTILGSRTLTGCPDTTIPFKPVDAQTLHGKAPTGAEIRLSRQP